MYHWILLRKILLHPAALPFSFFQAQIHLFLELALVLAKFRSELI